MGQTALSQLPYPEATQQPYVHLDIKELADKADESLFVECSSTSRPAHKLGRRIYERDTGLTLVSNGTSWQAYLPQPETIAVPMIAQWAASKLVATRWAGRVVIEGTVATTGGTVPNGTSLAIGVMPSGWRPIAVNGVAHGTMSGQILGAGLVYAPRGSLLVETSGNLSVFTEALLTTGQVSFGYPLT